MMKDQDSSSRLLNFPLQAGSYAAFGYLPILRAGFLDSFNPGALLGLLLFIVYLILVVESQQPYLWRGLLLMMGVGVTTVLIQVGFFNRLLSAHGFAIFLDSSYFLIASLAIIVSAILLRDWKIFKQEKNKERVRIKFDFIDHYLKRAVNHPDKLMINLRSNIVGGAAAYLCGTGIAFLETAWPPDVGIVYILYELTLPGRELAAILLFLIYALVFLLPLSIFFIIFHNALNSSRKLAKLQNHFSKVQMIAAAILMGYGIAFLREFIL